MKIIYTPDELALLALAKRTQTVEEYVHDTSVWAAWCRASDEDKRTGRARMPDSVWRAFQRDHERDLARIRVCKRDHDVNLTPESEPWRLWWCERCQCGWGEEVWAEAG